MELGLEKIRPRLKIVFFLLKARFVSLETLDGLFGLSLKSLDSPLSLVGPGCLFLGLLDRLKQRVFKLLDNFIMEFGFFGSGRGGNFNSLVPLGSFLLEGLFAEGHCLMVAKKTEDALNK